MADDKSNRGPADRARINVNEDYEVAYWAFSLAAALLFLIVSIPAPILAQSAQTAGPMSQEDGMRIVTEVRKRLAGLSNYDVFDWITFGFKGRTLVLNGFASRPTLKDDAGRAVKGIEGITGVDNEIKVLPLSPMDDRVRAEVYNLIYTQPALRKYNANQGSLCRPSVPVRIPSWPLVASQTILRLATTQFTSS